MSFLRALSVWSAIGQIVDAFTDKIEIIDWLFAEPIEIVENGAARRASMFEAIVQQLWAKEMTGSKRAMAVRLRYQAFASSQRADPGVILEYEND